MEEYVTRDEFEQFKKQVEHMTEPMRAINVNVASKDVLDRLDKLEQGQQSINQNITAIHDALSQRIVDEGNEVVERVEALLIKYLKPSTNGH